MKIESPSINFSYPCYTNICVFIFNCSCLCFITILNPYLLFMIARRHIMHTWISSVTSPILRSFSRLADFLNSLRVNSDFRLRMERFIFLLELPKLPPSDRFDSSSSNSSFCRITSNLEDRYSIRTSSPRTSSLRNSRTHSIWFVLREISRSLRTWVEVEVNFRVPL